MVGSIVLVTTLVVAVVTNVGIADGLNVVGGLVTRPLVGLNVVDGTGASVVSSPPSVVCGVSVVELLPRSGLNVVSFVGRNEVTGTPVVG